MTTSPLDVALLVSTYQRPANLRRVLKSIALQEGMDGRFEVVISDDGSSDETPRVVEEFKRSVTFPVAFTTHPRSGFQLARCRNEGVAASTAPYIIFLDGDCLIPPDHLRQHLKHRKASFAIAGHTCWLTEEIAGRITAATIESGEYLRWAPRSELRRLRKIQLKSHLYTLRRHPTKPKLFGGNIGIWRADYERVNGYDETFQGWGCEDDDLRMRLRRTGVRVRTILPWTKTFHLWHPPTASLPETWREGANVSRLERKARLAQCVNGLRKRPLEHLRISPVGQPRQPQAAKAFLSSIIGNPGDYDHPEIEVLFLPGEGSFTGRADFNLLVQLEDCPISARASREAHIILSDHPPGDDDKRPRFKLAGLLQALRSVV